MDNLRVGLFGTCGNSTWRGTFIESYNSLGILFYNPQLGVGEWKPECAEIEAEHLANDKIVVFPILSEELSLGSLGEMEFSILNAIKLDNRRNFIILIHKDLDDTLNGTPQAKDSITLRALVLQHLKKLNLDNVYLVDTLDEMLEVSVVLYRAEYLKSKVAKYAVVNKGIK